MGLFEKFDKGVTVGRPEKGGMEKKVIPNSSGKDIIVQAQLIGQAWTDDEIHQAFLYRTANKSLIVQRVNNQAGTIEVKKCAAAEEVVEFMGWGEVAKSLYDDAKFDPKLYQEEHPDW